MPQPCYPGSDPLSHASEEYSTSSTSSGGSASPASADEEDEYAPLVGGAGAASVHEGSPDVEDEEVETSSCCISKASGARNGSDSRRRTRDRRSSRARSNAGLDASGRRRSVWWSSGVLSSDPHQYTELRGEGGQGVQGKGFDHVVAPDSEEGGRGSSIEGGADGHARYSGSQHNLMGALKIIISNRIVLVLFAASSVRMIATWSMAGYMAVSARERR